MQCLGCLGSGVQDTKQPRILGACQHSLWKPKEFRKLDEGYVLLVADDDERITTRAFRQNTDKMKVLMAA